MKNFRLFSIIAALALVLSLNACSGSKSAASTNAEDPGVTGTTVTDLQPQLSLATYLRQLTGITVQGTGSNTKVFVRGVSVSEGGAKEPMFVIDGVPSGYSYSEVDSQIEVNDIAKLNVLKGLRTASRSCPKAVNWQRIIRINNQLENRKK